MSEYSSGMTLTDVGQALQVKKLAATEPLEITKAVYGDGKIADGTDIKALTAMASPKMTLPMVSSKVVGNGTAEISLLQDNSGVEAPGFPITEIGVYAKDGDAEILYSYAYFGDRYTWMPSPGGAETIYNLMKLDIVIGRTTQLTVNVKSDLAFTPSEDFQAHLVDANAHTALPHFGADYDASADASAVKYFYTDSGDGKVHRTKVNLTQKAVLGSDYANIKGLNNRVTAAESEIDDLIMADSAKSMYPDFTALTYGNFSTGDSNIDTFVCAVTNAVAGDDSLDVSSLSGITPKSWYTLTDGVEQEEVQVDACAKTSTGYRIILTSAVVNTYTLANLKLYRTTADVADGAATGSGIQQTKIWNPGVTWKGEKGSTSTNVELNTTLGNAGSYASTSGVAYTSDGLVTMIPATITSAALSGSTWTQIDGEGE